MRSLLLAVPVALLLVAAPAEARDLYVDSSGSATSGCLQSLPCHTIQQALDEAGTRNASAPDTTTIHVASGEYPGIVDTLDEPVIVVGSGVEDTAIDGDAPTGQDAVVDVGSGSADLTLTNLQVFVSGNSSKATTGIDAEFGHFTLDHAKANVDSATAHADNGPAIDVGQIATVDVSASHVTTSAYADAIRNANNLTVTDSTVMNTGGVTGKPDDFDAVAAVSSGTTTVVRSTLLRADQVSSQGAALGDRFTTSSSESPTFVVDSSVLRGGEAPIRLVQKDQTTHVTLQNATVDPDGAPSGAVLEAEATAGGATVVTVDSSVLLGSFPDGTFFRGTCTYTDVAGGADTSGQNHCLPSDPTNTTGGATLIDPANQNYEPAAGAGVIDTGNPSVPAGFSATDLSGNARDLPGKGGCVGARDKGAVEYTGDHGTPPSIAITGPSMQTGTGAQTYAIATADTVSSAWSTDDGASGAGPSFAHAFTTAGAHTVTLTATEGDGCSSVAQKSVTVVVAPAGPSGPSAPTGPTVPSGPSGPTGHTGPSGPDGGASGPSGPAGASGPSGTSGPSGGSGSGEPGGTSGPSGATPIGGTPDQPAPVGPPAPGPPAGAGGPPVDKTKPKLSGLKLTRKQVTVRASEPVRLTVKLCHVRRAHSKAKPTCVSATKRGSGTIKIKLVKPLAKGKYTVALTATDAAGNVAESRARKLKAKR